MYNVYLNAFTNSVRQYQETQSKDTIKKAVFYGVKIINLREKPKCLTRGIAENNFQFGSIVKDMIGLLTPKEFMEIFPITKDFRGHKRQVKDYFYTRDYINTLDSNKPIRENGDPLEFLWEYTNWDISVFNVNLLGYMSDLRELDGYPSMAAEWCEMNGIKTYEMHQDHKGNNFIIKDGKVLKQIKKYPKYLKLV